ncbi:hypothetical protein TNCV_4096731 [Trichonephila clavipes]|nr:hypothetical protein TNCV_4096731 [Trichonephila clavipes]
MYAKVEIELINYIRYNQSKLRTDIQYLDSIDYQNEELPDKTENYDIIEETNENQEEIPTLTDDYDEMPASDSNERIEKSLDEDETKSENQNEDASDDEMESKNVKESEVEEEIEPDNQNEYFLEPSSEDEVDKESPYADEDLKNKNTRHKIIKKRFSEFPSAAVPVTPFAGMVQDHSRGSFVSPSLIIVVSISWFLRCGCPATSIECL